MIAKHLLYPFLVWGAFAAASCSKENPQDGPDSTPLHASQTITATANEVTTIDSKLPFGTSATYRWSVEQASSPLYSFTGESSEKPLLLSSAAATFTLKLTALKEKQTYVRNITIRMEAGTKTPSPYIARVIDFLPAVGQFTNLLPSYQSGDSKQSILTKVETALVGKKNGSIVSLGGFGGYLVFGFDHTVANVKGQRDFRIAGNAFYSDANPTPGVPKGGSCEPGIVEVAYDANKNGKPDGNEWFEIAGSEYHKPDTKRNYEITYFRPQTETPSNPKQYIRWEDNLGNKGFKEKNEFHAQSYFPLWIADSKITLKGTKLADNATDQSGDGTFWVLYAYGFGYADNALNNEDDSAIDIGWAVDERGEKVVLPGIDFVRVHTATNQEAGWLGEVSTEIAGAADLHIEKE